MIIPITKMTLSPEKTAYLAPPNGKKFFITKNITEKRNIDSLSLVNGIYPLAIQMIQWRILILMLFPSNQIRLSSYILADTSLHRTFHILINFFIINIWKLIHALINIIFNIHIFIIFSSTW